jgi:transcriptional activator of cad operon
MERTTTTKLRIGEWCVDPAIGQISRQGESTRLEFRTMRLLLCLAEHPGEMVSIEALLNEVWPGTTVTSDSVYQVVTSLRRTLGDDPKQPTYIETVPRLGYRLVASVAPLPVAVETESSVFDTKDTSKAVAPHRRWLALAALLACLVIGIVAWSWLSSIRSVKTQPTIPPQVQVARRSIAVLPFLDLTEGMKEEEFADGITEEMIDKLSKVSGLQVASPTSSFYYKGKQQTVAEIAKALGVTYVLDGSVRKSGDRVRVAARLMRADNGYVIWTENYDRPMHDILMVQDDIAGEVTKALSTSTELKPR